jgi:predicted Zn-dependent peptidase
VLDALLGGNFISRLNMNLREEKHWSYGAGTRITDAVGQGTFRAGGGVQTDKTAESMVEIRKELRDVIGARKPDDAELHPLATASRLPCRAATRPRARSRDPTARLSPTDSRTVTGTTGR